MSKEHRPIHPRLSSQHPAFLFGDEKAKLERAGEGWGVMRSSIETYGEYFAKVSNMSIPEWLTERAGIHPNPALIDIMGFGHISYDLKESGVPLTHGYSLSLDHWAHNEAFVPFYAPDPHMSHITGNILDMETWESLEASKEHDGLTSFDMGIWLPFMGLYPQYITDSLDVYDELLRLIYDQIHEDHGVLLMSMPWWVINEHSRELANWIEKIEHQKMSKKDPWIQISYSGRENKAMTILIEKSPEHATLPFIGRRG